MVANRFQLRNQLHCTRCSFLFPLEGWSQNYKKQPSRAKEACAFLTTTFREMRGLLTLGVELKIAPAHSSPRIINVEICRFNYHDVLTGKTRRSIP